MFEKEAEEIAHKRLCSETLCFNRCNYSSPKHHRCGEWHRCYKSAKDGAEFGYDKGYHDANEWRYVKDGDLPKGDGLFVIYWKLGDIDNYMIFRGTIGTLHKDAIAWKEIVPPKE